MLSHRNLRANAMQGRAWVPGLDEGDEIFYGGAAALPRLRHDALPHLRDEHRRAARAVPEVRLGARARCGAALAADVPARGAADLRPARARRRASAARRLASIRFAISGAMSLPIATVDRWESATGGLLVEGYGMTESSPVALGNPMGPTRRPGTVGVPFPSTEIRVVDPDRPERRPARRRGRRAARARAAGLPGLLAPPGRDRRDAAARRLAAHRRHRARLRRRLRHDRRPGEGAHHHGRVQRLAVRGRDGPARATPTCAAPRSSACPRDSGGEAVAAGVELREGAVFDEAALRDFCRTSLTPYKVPRTHRAVRRAAPLAHRQGAAARGARRAARAVCRAPELIARRRCERGRWHAQAILRR